MLLGPRTGGPRGLHPTQLCRWHPPAVLLKAPALGDRSGRLSQPREGTRDGQRPFELPLSASPFCSQDDFTPSALPARGGTAWRELHVPSSRGGGGAATEGDTSPANARPAWVFPSHADDPGCHGVALCWVLSPRPCSPAVVVPPQLRDSRGPSVWWGIRGGRGIPGFRLQLTARPFVCPLPLQVPASLGRAPSSNR